MSRNKRKKRQASRNQQDARKFMMIVGLSTVVLLVLMYLVFQNS